MGNLIFTWYAARASTRRWVVSLVVIALIALSAVGYVAYRATTDRQRASSAAEAVDRQHARVVFILGQATAAAKACTKSQDPYACGRQANQAAARNLRDIRRDLAALRLPPTAEAARRILVGSLVSLANDFAAFTAVRNLPDAQHLEDEIAMATHVMDANFQELANALPH